MTGSNLKCMRIALCKARSWPNSEYNDLKRQTNKSVLWTKFDVTRKANRRAVQITLITRESIETRVQLSIRRQTQTSRTTHHGFREEDLLDQLYRVSHPLATRSSWVFELFQKSAGHKRFDRKWKSNIHGKAGQTIVFRTPPKISKGACDLPSLQ